MSTDLPKAQWDSRVLWVGIGCTKGSSKKLIECAIQTVCQNYHLAESAIAGIATIDLKADEVGLIEVCQARNWPLKTFPAEILRNVNVPNPSTVVTAEVGTPSVAEAAAIAVIRDWRLGMTGKMPVLRDWGNSGANLLVKKQVFRLEGEPGVVTIAVGLAEKEYSG
jgi:cobalt-precorrin 5A hydrolase/precorrin-3B C17-methyltransferase